MKFETVNTKNPPLSHFFHLPSPQPKSLKAGFLLSSFYYKLNFDIKVKASGIISWNMTQIRSFSFNLHIVLSLVHSYFCFSPVRIVSSITRKEINHLPNDLCNLLLLLSSSLWSSSSLCLLSCLKLSTHFFLMTVICNSVQSFIRQIISPCLSSYEVKTRSETYVKIYFH